MKKKTILALILVLSGVIHSCDESFLDKQAIGQYSDVALYTEEGVEQLLIGAYSMLNSDGFAFYASPMNCTSGVISGGEAYKGSDRGDVAIVLEYSQYGVTTGNDRNMRNWKWLWNGIDRCNSTLSVLSLVTNINPERKTEIEAEARFLRGFYYFEAKIMYGNIPWIDETVKDARVPNTDEDGNYVNIWPNIANDFDFARKNLPDLQSEVGRPNKWAADCFYAKIMIYRAGYGEYPEGYAEALPILTDAINNGFTMSGDPYDLLSNYHDNFDPGTENGPESVWAVQCTVNDGTPSGFRESNNAMIAAQNWSSQSKTGPGLGMGYGFFQPTEWFVNHFRTDANGLPFLDMFETNAYEVKDDYGLASAPEPPAVDPFVPDTCGLDPRLDWTVGRRGISFLGYGPMPGAAWIRNQAHGGPYFMKKFHVYRDKMGVYTGSGNCYPSINMPIMRFSDVLLLAAECEARIGSLSNARDLVNRVRRRMIDNADSPANYVKMEDGFTDAANYRIGLYPNSGPEDAFSSQNSALDAILFERTLELGFEGSRFFDVIRFGKAEEEFEAFLSYAKERHDYLNEAGFESTEALFPIPRDAVDLSQKNGFPTLKQNPGY